MDILRDKDGISNVRLIILVFVVLTGIVAALLYFPPIPTRTAEGRTSGDITFLDGTGNPLSGAIEISGAGISGGQKSNVNYVSWTNVPNARIYYNVLDTKSIAVNLRISGDSPKGRVIQENYAATIPKDVNVTAPGTLVKYVEISATGVSFVEADIAIKYTEEELNGQDENNLAIYRYDNNTQSWSELSTKIDANNNIASATVNSLSIFAVSTRIPQDIEIHDTGKMPVISDIKTYDEARTLKKEAKTSKISSVDVPDRGELEVDALATKNVAVKLKVNVPSKGEIILDDFGKKNPVSVPLPGRVVKYVEIGASGISFSSADITIRYTDAELNGGNENDLIIYHWNGVSWDAVPTVVDTLNKTLSATTSSLSYWGVATTFIYYLQNNRTIQSVGADGNTNSSASGTLIPLASRPYKNLLRNGTMGTTVHINFTTTGTQEYELFRFYLPFNYSNATRISANTTFNISYRATSATNNRLNVSLIDYNPINGAKTVIGNRTFNATSTARGNYSSRINHSAYTIPKGNRLMLRINVTTATNGNVSLFFNDTFSNVTIIESVFLSNISGYVRNASSGATLSGATVTTNTSLTTTTNASGFYNFTGVANGTYLINASLIGYANNSINVTISGADNTTANISLTPLPTYLLSGYVTNSSNGAAINGATVTTNTSLTTSTDAAGYYNFTLANGTYIITASNTSYYDNSFTQIINGAAVSNVNITLTPLPSLAGILVATNRYSITSFINGPADSAVALSGYDIDNSSFTFTGGALVIDTNGRPVSGENVYYEIKSAAGVLKANGTKVTASNGLVLFSYNTTTDFTANADPDYGTWTVMARLVSNTSINKTVGVNISIAGYTSSCSKGYCHHNPTDLTAAGSTQTSPRSPYSDKFGISGTGQSMAAGAHLGRNHGTPCVKCHPGYGYGNPGRTVDSHSGFTCDNANCHGAYGSSWPTLIPSCYNANCHPIYNRNLTNITTLATIDGITNVSIYSTTNKSFVISYSVHNGSQYSNTTGVPCWICHGPMHNITKPDPLPANKNNITEYTQCTTCHNAYKRHNDSVSCTVCHSQDAHIIKVFAQNATYINGSTSSFRGNCTNCHQNSTFFNILLSRSMAGNYSGGNPPQIPVPLNHSTDPYAGWLWNTTQRFWDNTSQKSACYYCHGLSTLHSTSALGSVSNVKGTNNLNQDLTISRWCANCHYKNAPDYAGTSFSPEPPEIVNASGKVPATSRDGTTFANHSSYFSSGYNDSVCKNCHNNNLAASATSLNFSHNVAIGSGGAPNCIQCHNLVTGLSGGAPVGVNFTAVNLSVHYGINSQNATNWSYVPVIGACWACHDTVGNVSTGHPDRYKTPKDCDDCHLAAGTYYNQSQKWGLNVTVKEHYYGGDQIHAGNSSSNISSCINCHENVSEMIIYNNDTDYGSFTGDGVRLTGGNMSFYHYGKNRTDLRSWDSGRAANCSYCHQNTSTVFATAMLDPTYNSSINNHSLRYNSSNPSCTSSQCHNSGWIHNSTLTKPNLTLPNSTFCLNCHGGNSTGSINFTGAITSIKEKHNNTINCTECHLSSSRDIHPMKYLQPNASYNTINSTAVNCINCHQNLTVYPNQTRTPPKIPDPMHHSDNAANGTLWNTTGYWTNNTITSCIYCHNDTKHNATALGRPAYWKGNNVVNSSITSTSSWCAGCHYQGYLSGGKTYNDMTSTFNSANQPVPPEITGNATYGSYANNSRYYNHALTNYTDAACKVCHGMNLTLNDKITVFVHNNITWGSCTDCHYSFVAMNTTTRPDRYVNATLFNNSPHGNGRLTCQNCHTKGHKNIGARKACEDCHAVQAIPITDRDRHNITRTPSPSVVNITDCTTCHDATLYSEATTTYGFNRTRDCGYCHTYPDKSYS